jgi:hypothetical protein
MTARLFVRKPAKADVAAAFDWYEAHKAGLGDEFADQSHRGLRSHRRATAAISIVFDDVGMALVRRFPYVVYFVVLPRHTSVIAVVHGHRRPQVWRQRR